MNDHALAAQLATEAGELLLARLADHRPADAVLSEESADSAARIDADRVWIIDPLDGAREFSEPVRTDWVAVATAAGLHPSRLDGSPLVYNQANPWLPDLLICRPDLAGRVLDALGRIGVETVQP